MADFGQNMSSQFIFVNKGNFINITAVELEFGIYSSLLYKPQKLALTSPTGGGRSVGIVRVRTKATEFSLLYKSSRLQQTNKHTMQILFVVLSPFL